MTHGPRPRFLGGQESLLAGEWNHARLRARALRSGLYVAALLFVAGVCVDEARAQPSGSVIDRARTEYDARRYRLVISQLRPMLYPRSQLASEDEEVTAYTLLAKSYWWLGQLEQPGSARDELHREAARQFSALLSLRPQVKLSSLIHPQELLDFVEEVRKRLTAQTSPMKALETELRYCRKSLAGEKDRFLEYRRACGTRDVDTRTVTRRYYFWNFVPFGAGQFQNGHTLKGSLFAAGQGAMLLLNIGAFVIGETKWVRNDGRYIGNDLKSRSRARDIQNLQITSGVLFWSLVVWGIVDAMVYYKKTTVSHDRRTIPIGTGSVEVMPEVGPDRLVLGLTARF